MSHGRVAHPNRLITALTAGSEIHLPRIFSGTLQFQHDPCATLKNLDIAEKLIALNLGWWKNNLAKCDTLWITFEMELIRVHVISRRDLPGHSDLIGRDDLC